MQTCPTLPIGSLEEEEATECVATEARPWGKLICISKNSPNLELKGKSLFTLGRKRADCDFVFEHQGISGVHCKIWKDIVTVKGKQTNFFWIEDYSTNGTRLDHEKLGKGTKKVLTVGATVDLLWITKDHESNLSFIFQSEAEDIDLEKGGPQEKYIMCHVLGTHVLQNELLLIFRGNFATVRMAINKETQERFAIKIVDKKNFLKSTASPKRETSLMDEVKILQGLKHPGIVNIEEAFETESKLYIVLELVTGGELFDLVVESGHFPEPQAKHFFRQLLEATQYLHNQKIAHRDLKLENILVKEKGSNIIKIADFGMSRVSQSFMQTMCGTPQYVAPEVLTNEGYGKACDLWSLGVILYVMLAGYPPFNETKQTSVYQQIKTADFDFPNEWWSKVSQQAKDLITQLLVVDPTKRLTVGQALESEWMSPTDPKRKAEQPAAKANAKRSKK